MSASQEGKDLAAILERDLKKLGQQVAGFQNDAQLWQTLPGVENCAGNLVLHLEGNLREYVGRQLGGIAYTRVRPAEFSTKDAPAAELSARVQELVRVIPPVLAGLSTEKLGEEFPDKVLGVPMSNRQFLAHLIGHLNYHMGQMDYLRRILTSGTAIDYVRLSE